MTRGQHPVEQKITAEPGAHIQNVVQAVIEQVTLGVRALPTDYATRIANFLCDYLGTPERPVPFGGREEALQALNRWLDDPTAPPYLLLAAPAGRGKSALLVRWLERLRQRTPDLPVVFVPVSLRYETASQAVFFAALAARLAHLFGDKVPADLSQAPDVWRGMASSYLNRPAPNGRLLVVLDGLDEATDWQAGPDLFPFQPPPGLRVVVSARCLAGERGPEGWLRRLGWDRLARPLDLDPLTREGVAEVLRSMGFPLDELGRRVDIVAELHRLSEGDPLLVRLYVDDLWARGEAAARLRPEDLRTLRPGLEGYFDRWWEDQRKQWGEKAPLKEPAVREVLNLLAAALAPLGQEDLLALSQLDTWTLEEALRLLARLVVGDGKRQGYAFSHPRLGQYFWEKLSRREQQALEGRFLDWGLGCVEGLRRGEVAPQEVSPYLVRALGGHLARAGAGPEDWLRLVHGAWAAAGEALEGAYSLFLHDVARAWRACAAADREATARGEPAPYLGGEVRCALVEASLHSLAGNIPPALLAALVEKGVWTPAQGLAYARQVPDTRQQAEAFEKLAPHLPEGLLLQALDTARNIGDEYARAHALAAMAPHLPQDEQPQVLDEALTAAREIQDGYWRAEALAALAPHLPEDLLEQALAAAREIGDESARAEALAALALRLTEMGYPQEALAAAREIRDADDRAQALADLAPHLPEDEQRQVLDEALDTARKIGDESARAQALADLAPRLPPGQQPQVLAEALAAAREIEWESARAEALAALAPHLQSEMQEDALKQFQMIIQEEEESYWYHYDEDQVWGTNTALEIADELDQIRAVFASSLAKLGQVQEALNIAGNIWLESYRAEALADLAPYLPSDLLAEALTAARKIGDADDRARVLAALAPHLPPEQQSQVLDEALDAVKNIGDESALAQALADLAPRLAELGYPQEALAAAREIEDEDDRAQALAALVPRLAELGYPQEALAVVREIRDAKTRTKTLAASAPRLAESGYPQEALDAAGEIGDEYWHAEALAALAPHLPEDLLKQALAAAGEIRDADARAEALAALAPRLAEFGYPQEALAAARNIGDEYARAQALAALAPHLPPDLLEQALDVAREIRDADARAEALAALAPYLPPKQQPQALVEALDAIRKSKTLVRFTILAALAPHLPPEQQPQVLAEALAAAREIRLELVRANALAVLAPRLAELPRPALYPLWDETLPLLARQTRRRLLADLWALVPVIHALGGAEAIAETFRAIQDVAHWWP